MSVAGHVPEVLRYPHPTLLAIAEPVDDLSEEALEELFVPLVAALDTQEWGDRLGIAAPQVGISKRAIVVLGEGMVNPTWEPARGTDRPCAEGCYSLERGKLYKVWRPQYGWATWTDIEGNTVREKLTGLRAQVFQHELDHLNGELCNHRRQPD